MFVQVIQGRVGDAGQLRARMEQWVRDLSGGAIGWLGSTAGVTADGTGIAVARFESADAACLHGEGGFTRAEYFTSEAEARVGERKRPPPEAQASLEEGGRHHHRPALPRPDGSMAAFTRVMAL